MNRSWRDKIGRLMRGTGGVLIVASGIMTAVHNGVNFLDCLVKRSNPTGKGE